MSWSLPKLPGYSFRDPGKEHFHLPHKLTYINGYARVRIDPVGVGRSQTDSEGTEQLDVDNQRVFDPRLIYGSANQQVMPIVKPHYVIYDKKFLLFKAYLKECGSESIFDTTNTPRLVNIMYHLEDDTLSIDEPHVKNSGLLHGKVVKRGRISKDGDETLWHWKDFNVGIDVKINGMTFHIIYCDDFTKKFLTSQGIEVHENEDDSDVYFEGKSLSPQKCFDPDRNLRRFLLHDNKTLKFDVVWDDSKSEYGEVRNYKLLYYLYDDTISIKEINQKNQGRDPFPKLLSRTRVPKNWKNIHNHSALTVHDGDSNDDDEGFYDASDLIVGNTVNILMRPFLIYDCDYNTRCYYKDVLHITQPPRIELKKDENKSSYLYDPPPHIGIGDPEDTLMSCFTFHSKPPFKDIVQYNSNANLHLRYLCEMISVHPEDTGRKFVLVYNLADGTIRIDELTAKNSGLPGGRFFGPNKVHVPGGSDFSYYTPDMFYIGGVVTVNRHEFIIVGADLFVYKYMKTHPDKFPPDIIENMRRYHAEREVVRKREDDPIEHNRCNIRDDETQDMPITDDHRYHGEADLPPVLQCLDSAQALPNISDNVEQSDRAEGPSFVCVTGLTQSQDDGSRPELHEPDAEHFERAMCLKEAVPSPEYEAAEGSTKRVTFADSTDDY